MNNLNALKMKKHITFILHFTVIHFATYFVIGLITFFSEIHALAYYEHHPLEMVSQYFRNSNSLLVMAGPLLQIPRGILLAIALFPIRQSILEKKVGWIYLWLLFLVFAILAPSGAAPGSIEGVIYTKLPAKFHMLYLPELFIQTALCSFLFFKAERNELEKWMKAIIYAISITAILMLTAGIIQEL